MLLNAQKLPAAKQAKRKPACSANGIRIQNDPLPCGKANGFGKAVPGPERPDRDAVTPGDGGEGIALRGRIDNVVTRHDEAATGAARPVCAA